MSEHTPAKGLKILILCQNQFGFHVDTYFYCRYLRKKHELTYLCWDYNRPRQALEKVAVQYISRKGNIVARNMRYLSAAVRFLRNNRVDICFIKYFRGCSMLRLFFPRVQFVFDIRSGSISGKKLSRLIYDSGMRFEAIFFKHITVISQSLDRKLRLEKKTTILPLGSVSICNDTKLFKTIDLIYVGTLSNRNIDKTIIGFSGFIDCIPSSLQCTYTIIGSGYHKEEEQLRALVKAHGLEKQVKIVGHVPFPELPVYFAKANIGISFVPITPYYNVQPPTKTFDYLLSGMAVIGTATSENKLVIDNSNGVLIDDTSKAFQEGLIRVLSRKNNFSSETIRKNAEKYHWQNIIHLFDQYLLELSHHAEQN